LRAQRSNPESHKQGLDCFVAEFIIGPAKGRTRWLLAMTGKTMRERSMATPNIPLWEVFIRSRNGLAHKHVGSLHATDATLALQAARDIYTRRGEGLSIWVVPSNAITASDPSEKGMMFEPAESKIYRHPTFYDVPDEVGHM
jgi:ring-1,2-phenylacetyl-CoA epoxidase subunit PaaB